MAAVRTDAYVAEDRASANFQQSAKLWLRGSGSSQQKFAYLFAPIPFPLDATILSATLRVFIAGSSWTGTEVVTAKLVTAAWRESQVTWNNKPAVTATHSASASPSGASDGSALEINVAAMLADLAAGQDNFGIRLELGSDVARSLYSTEYPNDDLRPVLEVNWSVAPEAPVNLKPSGGRVVSLTKPRLSWQFADHAKDAQIQQASSRVQVSTSTDFSAPSFDSGMVANTDNGFDLSLTSFAALADGATRWWRVQVTNDDGLTSEWSEVVSFTRKAKGTLTITNPAVSPNNFVEERTPPMTATFSGTLTAWRGELFLIKSTGKRVSKYVWTRRPGTAIDFHIPDDFDPKSKAKVGLQSGENYEIDFWAWDDQDRQAIPGDPDYVLATRAFTYQRSGVPAAVTSLTATADPTYPKVTLQWSRSTMPDYFQLKINGKEVGGYIDPTEVLVSGTTYRMDWWRASGSLDTYEVEAVVRSSSTAPYKHSAGNATATAQIKVKAKWLVDEDDSTAVQIMGAEQATFEIGESATTHYPVGNQAPTRVIDAIRGYEGTPSGLLGPNEATAEGDFLALKSRRRKVFRYIQSTKNVPVILGQMTHSPDSTRQGNWFIGSVAVIQVGEFEVEFP
jgi:hypothetical protein